MVNAQIVPQVNLRQVVILNVQIVALADIRRIMEPFIVKYVMQASLHRRVRFTVRIVRHQQLTMTLREVFVNVVRQANTHDGRVRFTVRIVSQDHTHQPVANVDLVPKGNSVILTVQYLVMYVRIVPRGNLHGWVLLILLTIVLAVKLANLLSPVANVEIVP